mgnify:CR=1 FL=1
MNLKRQLTKFIRKGFTHAFHYKEGESLERALDYRMIASSAEKALEIANKLHYTGERSVKIWNLKEELLNLEKK